MKKNQNSKISCYNPFKVDEDTKWNTRILRQMQTADPVGMGRKSCLYTILSLPIFLWKLLVEERLVSIALLAAPFLFYMSIFQYFYAVSRHGNKFL